MFTDIAGNQQGNDRPLNASNPADFKMIYDASMQLLFKISYRIVNDEEAAEDLAHDSLIKALVFPNSFLAVKLGLEAITFRDIVHLPLGAGGRRNAIVVKAVMEKCAPLLHRYRFFMDLSPHFDGRRFQGFQRLCAVIVAAYISIYGQAEKTQALFDHRTRYLRKEK